MSLQSCISHSFSCFTVFKDMEEPVQSVCDRFEGSVYIAIHINK